MLPQIRYTPFSVFQFILHHLFTIVFRILWHDIQLLIKGPATQLLRLHFAQRWVHSFSQNPNLSRNISFQSEHVSKHITPAPQKKLNCRYQCVCAYISLYLTNLCFD
jgi:phosphatidylserine/phosphatidylglycerophosphate/cardiolipin synthase-like enzyme